MTRVAIHADTYIDSVALLSATRAMLDVEGVSFATAVMATPANVDALRNAGITDPSLDAVSANDLALAVAGADEDADDRAIAAAQEALFAARARSELEPVPLTPRTIEAARAVRAGANVALISVPGAYASIEAHKALSLGLHVLLFSDNVPVEEEVELKRRATQLGRLVMGPGAGTAVIGGCGLGFANAVARGRVGVVAAAGTGAQEVMTLLDRWGAGVSQVIGVGGRDLTAAVGGEMARAAVRALDADPGTDVIALVSKPPDIAVAEAVMSEATTTPIVAALIGMETGPRITGTLEAGARRALELVGGQPPDHRGGLSAAVEAAMARLDQGRTAVHGLYSGGTLCYEALVVLGAVLGPVYSNIPLDPAHRVPAPEGAHVCLDLGEEEYTRGRPHPMIDPEARLSFLAEAGARPEVAAIVVDVVLGHGAHHDPAGAIAPVCEAIATNRGPVVVAYVLGTDGDPQGLERQRRTLADAGCVLAPTARLAAVAAAAIARRDPRLVERTDP
jgi:FdrA protein